MVGDGAEDEGSGELELELELEEDEFLAAMAVNFLKFLKLSRSERKKINGKDREQETIWRLDCWLFKLKIACKRVNQNSKGILENSREKNGFMYRHVQCKLGSKKSGPKNSNKN